MARAARVAGQARFPGVEWLYACRLPRENLMPRATIVLLLATFAACEIAAETKAEGCRPCQITHGPKFHWFGYYDKLEFDPTSRYVLANEVDFEGRSPTAADVIRVGMIDLADHDKWIELGESRAWSWQQGCMLQWRPGSKSEVLWNDREGDHYVCRILDVFTRRKRTIPTVIYALSPGGRQAVAADFRRVQDHRPGYGYAGLPDPCKGEAVPATSGVWSVDLETGESKLVVSIAQAAAIPYENGDRRSSRYRVIGSITCSTTPTGRDCCSCTAGVRRQARNMRTSTGVSAGLARGCLRPTPTAPAFTCWIPAAKRRTSSGRTPIR